MKNGLKVFYFAVSAFVLASSIGLGSTKSAAAAGNVIKGSSPALYYLAADGKRYVFPNDKAYFSWYSNFSGVQKVSDSVLASYPLGGNVTYRPGLQLVKIQSDPRVYAVDKGGVLRWVNSESAAVAIFGSNWNKHVDDIADAFFINYTLGTPIYSAGDYSPSALSSVDASIDLDRSFRSGYVPSTNNNSSVGTGTVTLSLSPYASTLAGGQSTTATAVANDTDGLASIKIFATAAGTLTQNCPLANNPGSGTCSLNIYANDYANGANVSVYAQATDRNGNVSTSSTSTLNISNGNTTTGSGNVTLSLSPYASTLLSGQTTNATATAYNASGIASMGFYVNNSLYQTCPVANYPTNNSCVASLYGSSYANGTTLSVYARITDQYGNVSTSSTTTLVVGSSAAANAVTISLAPYSSTLLSGQSTTVTANANDTDGIASVSIYVNGTLAQNCSVTGYPTSYNCSLNIFGSNYINYSNILIYGQVTDRNGGVTVSSTTTLPISSSNSSSGSVTLSLSPSLSALVNGQSTTITASANDTDGISSVIVYLNGAQTQSCPVGNYPTSASCAVTIYGSNFANGSNITVYATMTDRNGNLSTSSTTTLNVQNSGSVSGTTNSVALSLSPYVSVLAADTITNVVANASGGNGLTSMTVYVNGASVQNCTLSGYPSTGTCVFALYGSNYANGSNVSVFAQSTDRYGNLATSQTTTLSVQNATGQTSGSNATSLSLSLSPSSSTISRTQSVSLTATANDTDGIASVSIYVNGTPTTCQISNYPTAGVCTLGIYGGNYVTGTNVAIYAQAMDRYGNTTSSSTSNLSVQ